jgi:hypothetical protein
MIHSESQLISVCLSLIGSEFLLTAAERRLSKTATADLFHMDSAEVIRKQITDGRDPLGEAFLKLRSSHERREMGAVYTPAPIIESMVDWLSSQGTPDRVIDPGAGSGRFLLAAARRFSHASLIGVELDPVAALILRANLVANGLHGRAQVLVQDYRSVRLPACAGPTAFVGNPPYVRHHQVDETWKDWYVTQLAKLGIKGSALAGLHLHFFLKTALVAKPGDVGAFVTSAEWMDVNYGSALRKLLLSKLGGLAVHVLKPTVEAFPGTATTAAVTCFRADASPASLRMRSVQSVAKLNGLASGKPVSRERLAAESRWSVLLRPSGKAAEGIELGELFRVHRGQVTGANSVWIAGEHSIILPDSILYPAVTKARDLIQAGETLHSSGQLRRVIDIPHDLDSMEKEERKRVERFLSWARSVGADQGYIARHRKEWWSVGLKAPAPILCTYMARRAPQFTLNDCDARHINIAHGLYPRTHLSKAALKKIVAWLNGNVDMASGRVYAGGLTKFEPREVERLVLPADKALLQ